MIKKKLLILVLSVFTSVMYSQTIREYNYNSSNGSTISTWYDSPGKIVYPTGYSNSSSKTPVIFVHGITGKMSNSYNANIDQVKRYNLKAAFVQLKPLGSTIENGKLLSKMIDRVRWHYNAETVSIVAHSKGGMDTERALYGQNAYTSANLPSFKYEKVDGVYTFSSPVRGARVADVGSTLSWFSGVVWATMWYTNGWSLTSGNVNSFHNWARGWRINSNTTFKNYYNQNGRSYSRINLSEDNTTRWWAHQSNDECYKTAAGSNTVEWVFCYVGRPFQHSVGAYIDAYWEWDWFDSGWRNWHSNSDGFISEYRAKRVVNANASPSYTPGAGDSNYRTMQDANHTSLWEKGQDHFSREAAPYLHYGLYNGASRPSANAARGNAISAKDPVIAKKSSILASSGNLYYGKDGKTNFIVEESNKMIEFVIYGENEIRDLILINKETGKETKIEIIGSNEDTFSKAAITVANASNLEKGNYDLLVDEKDFLVVANNKETSTAFAVNLNFDAEKGYDGETMEVGIANEDNGIDFNSVKVKATLSMVALDENTPIKMDKVVAKNYVFKPTSKKGIYAMSFGNLNPGSTYSLRIEAISEKGDVLLSRNIVSSFYVKKDIRMKDISVIKNNENKAKRVGSLSIDVYPNPTANKITVNSITKETINKVELLNDRGEVVKSFNVNTSKFDFNAKALNLSKGLYMLRISTNAETVMKKIIIE